METVIDVLSTKAQNSFLLGFVLGATAVWILTRLSALFPGLASSKSKIYTSDNVILNLPDNPSTWMNLGLWNAPASPQTSTSNFEAACTNLALALAQEARFTSQDIVFDAGFGCGDQDFLWADKYKMQKITAYNVSESQFHIAQSKQKSESGQSKIEFRCGDAVLGLAQSPDGSFTKIISLDSAYHFRTRADFITEAHRCLDSNRGRFVIIDLALSRPLRDMSFYDKMRTRLIAYLAGIPQQNLWMAADFERNLQKVGFSSVSVRPITPRSDEDIFHPLSQHISRSLSTYNAIVSSTTRAKFASAARLMKFIGDHKLFEVVIVSAEKLS